MFARLFSVVVLVFALTTPVFATPQGIKTSALLEIEAELKDTSEILGSADRQQFVINSYKCAHRIIKTFDDAMITEIVNLPEEVDQATYDTVEAMFERLGVVGYAQCVDKDNLFPITNTEVERLGVNIGIDNSVWLAIFFIRD